MRVGQRDYRTVWMEGGSVLMIEQNRLPFEFCVHEARSCAESCHAIRSMITRGAGAIGALAGYAMAQAYAEAAGPGWPAPLHPGPAGDIQDWAAKRFGAEGSAWPLVAQARAAIEATRPTAQNLFYATARVDAAGRAAAASGADPVAAAAGAAQALADADADTSRRIGEHGAALIPDGAGVATHCNAGWLAFVDYGTALAPIYLAHTAGRRLKVYADETRPRGQGARLTAWELHNAGVPHVIVPDNALASLMARGKIQLMLVGADRIAANGDTANKIGTLEKAICARHYGVPFYVAAPLATIDAACPGGAAIPIEERSPDEVLFQSGPTVDGRLETIRVASPGSTALNPAFDVTPAALITGLITEAGVLPATSAAIAAALASALAASA